MKIDLDRLATLAGLSNESTKMLSEGRDHDAEVSEDMHAMEEAEEMEEADEMDEMIEIDEVMLVQELRRAKKLMAESAQREQRKADLQKRRQHRLQEAELKAIIEDEVQNVMSELNLNSGWVYGNQKPRRSKKGFSHQGSFLKGIGFK